MDAVLVLDNWPSIQELVIKNDSIPFHRVAILTVQAARNCYKITLVNPQPLTALVDAFDQCYQCRIIDQNAAHQAQLEFGRYMIEFWDEDNVVGQVTADQLDYCVIPTE